MSKSTIKNLERQLAELREENDELYHKNKKTNMMNQYLTMNLMAMSNHSRSQPQSQVDVRNQWNQQNQVDVRNQWNQQNQKQQVDDKLLKNINKELQQISF